VRIADVERIYDRFLEAQLVGQQSSVGNYTAQQDSLNSVEGILNENNGGGINDALGAFLNAGVIFPLNHPVYPREIWLLQQDRILLTHLIGGGKI